MKKTKEIFKCTKEEDFLSKIKQWSKQKKMIEICGFLGADEEGYVLWLCENIAEDPKKYFSIDPLDFLTFKESYRMACVFHSHVLGNEDPSEFDVTMSENCCVPFMVYSLNTDRFKIHKPKENDADKNLIDEIQKII